MILQLNRFAELIQTYYRTFQIRSIINFIKNMKKDHYCVTFYSNGFMKDKDVRIKIKNGKSTHIYQMNYMPILQTYIIFFKKKKIRTCAILYFNFIVDGSVVIDTYYPIELHKPDNTSYNILDLNRLERLERLERCAAVAHVRARTYHEARERSKRSKERLSSGISGLCGTVPIVPTVPSVPGL